MLSCRESDLHVLCDLSKVLTDKKKLRYVVELVLQEYCAKHNNTLGVFSLGDFV